MRQETDEFMSAFRDWRLMWTSNNNKHRQSTSNTRTSTTKIRTNVQQTRKSLADDYGLRSLDIFNDRQNSIV